MIISAKQRTENEKSAYNGDEYERKLPKKRFRRGKEEQVEHRENAFFAAANTEEGFCSLYDDIFSPETLRHITILKGGPGTGKSTLMRQIGIEAETRGLETEYYYCSSDTDSLDGVLIPSLGTAVIDGTAPHMTDPKFPGAVERILNLGEAFDFAALSRRREEIISLSRHKSEAYRTAYRYLFTAGRMARELTELSEPAFLFPKADAAIGRLVGSFRRAKKGTVKIRYLSAIGVHGERTLDTLRTRATHTCAVTDKYGLGYLFMARLRAALTEKGIGMTVCPTPLIRSRTESIYIEGEDLFVFVTDDETAQTCEKIINVSRFLRRETLADHRGRLRFSEKCLRTLLDGALESLAEAGETHAALERIYTSAMDFSRVDAMRRGLAAEIFAKEP